LYLTAYRAKLALITEFNHKVEKLFFLGIHINHGGPGSTDPSNVPVPYSLIELILNVLLGSMNLVDAYEHIAKGFLYHVVKEFPVLRDLCLIVILVLAKDRRGLIFFEGIESDFHTRDATEVSAHLLESPLEQLCLQQVLPFKQCMVLRGHAFKFFHL
jgi:hypothetical protein